MGFRNISAWSIRNPVPSIVLFLMILSAGLGSLASDRRQTKEGAT